MNPFDTPEGRKALEKMGWTPKEWDDWGGDVPREIVAMIDWLDEHWGSFHMFHDGDGWCVYDGLSNDDARFIEAPTLLEALVAAVNATPATSS